MDWRILALGLLWVALPQCWCGAQGLPRPPAAAPAAPAPDAGTKVRDDGPDAESAPDPGDDGGHPIDLDDF